MIHVFFSEAAAGILKLHQEAGRIPQDDTIIVLGFMFDQGDIQQPYYSPYRMDLIFRMYTQNGQILDPESLKQSIQQYVDNVDLLLDGVERGEEIRVYTESSPSDVSGYVFLCNLLDPYDVGIKYIEIPHAIHNPNYNHTILNLESILYEQLDYVLSLEVDIPYYDINFYSMVWENLKEENSPLRAIVNGQIMSVSEDIYDFLILNRFETSKLEIQALGEIIGIYQQKLSDYFLADRIQKLIDQDQLTVLEDHEVPYDRLLIRTN